MSSTPFRDILTKNSREVSNYVINSIIEDPSRMKELMDCFFDESLRICHYASWPAGMIAEHNPELIIPYLDKMLANLDTPHHDAVVRNTFRTLQNLDIPEDLEGIAFEKAFDFLLNPQNAIAIRVFAMSVCGNIAKKYPELKHELVPVIEEQMPYGSAGFISRGKKVLKSLQEK